MQAGQIVKAVSDFRELAHWFNAKEVYSTLQTCSKKSDVLENPSKVELGFSRISNLIQVYFWDFLEIACWYWPNFAIVQATELGLGRNTLNFRQKCGFQEDSSLSDSLKIQAQC